MMIATVAELHAHIEKLTGQKLQANDWSLPPNRDLGDLAIPCFKLAKALGKAPPVVATELADALNSLKLNYTESVKNVGPYLNVFVKIKTIAENCFELVQKNPTQFGSAHLGKKTEAIVIDFSSPNMAKEVALHHLRSTAIGNSLSRIAELQGYQVVRLNYLGDWGTTHGKNIVGLQLFGDEKKLVQEGLPYMLDIYVQFNKAEKENPELSNKAKLAFSELEAGNPEYRRIWNLFRDISIQEFKKLYQQLGISFDFFDGESMYDKAIETVIGEIQNKIGTRISDGALVCDIEGFETPVLLKKDDGASLYLTRDLAAAEDRFKRFQFVKSWYVVAIQQKLHFQQVFKVLEKLEKPWASRCEHVPFGMLSFGSKTMKSREGNVIFLKDVLEEGKKKALEIIQEKNPNLENAEQIAAMIGTGALLFFDLSQHRNHDVKFDWASALSFEGDTAPFIQYTHARCTSLLEKGHSHLVTLEKNSTENGSIEELAQSPAVRRLVSDWAYFEAYAKRAFDEKDPSQIASATLNIAKSMNGLYHKVRFVDETSYARLHFLLKLTETTQKIIAHGLGLLGIQAPQRM